MQESNVTDFATAGDTLSRTVANAGSGVHQAIDRASGVVRPAVDQWAAGAHGATDTMTAAATKASASLEAVGGRLDALRSTWTRNCSTYVREQPVQALGVAAAGGFLLGLLLRLR